MVMKKGWKQMTRDEMEEIAGWYLDKSGGGRRMGMRGLTQARFGIGARSLNRALYETGNEAHCQPSFVALQARIKAAGKSRYKFHQQKAAPSAPNPVKEAPEPEPAPQLPAQVPDFEQMFRFLLDMMSKADQVNQLTTEVRELRASLDESLAERDGLAAQVNRLQASIKVINDMKMAWEVQARGSGVVHSKD